MNETIWKDIDDEDIHKALKLDEYEKFEELFAAKESKLIDQTSNSRSDGDISSKEITFLDGKRSQNISNQY